MTMPPDPPRATLSVRVGRTTARPLAEPWQSRILRAVVDTRLHAPAMIELTFLDDDGDLLAQSGITFGMKVEVWTGSPEEPTGTLVGAGEVTALEGDYYDLSLVTVVRAYDAGHRLQRQSHSRTFINQTDADIARRIAREAQLPLGRIEATHTSHAHLAQMNQTDWDFLSWRCRQIGYEFGIEAGAFYFRPASRAEQKAVNLRLQHNLRTFRPRVTGANLAAEAEVRAWDPLEARVVTAKDTVTQEAVRLPEADVHTIVRELNPPVRPAPPPSSPAFGPAPAPGARVGADTAPGQGTAIGPASRETLRGTLRRMADSFAEAEATAWGDPNLRAGGTVEVAGAPAPFSGLWTIAAAQHVFDVTEGGYRTRLHLGTAEDRTLLSLSRTHPAQAASSVTGLVCGVVTDVNDPVSRGRVKVVLPWLSPDLETDWAPVVQPAGGQRAGALLLPEVGDQVLVGFELGDIRRPYVVGGVLSNSSRYTLGGAAVESTGTTAEVVRRGIVSPTGNMLVFHDKLPATAGQPPMASTIALGTRDVGLGLVVDQVAGTVTLTCRPQPPLSKSATGSVRIECGDGGTVDIRAGRGGRVTIDGGSALKLTALDSIDIESAGTVAIKGAQIELN